MGDEETKLQVPNVLRIEMHKSVHLYFYSIKKQLISLLCDPFHISFLPLKK